MPALVEPEEVQSAFDQLSDASGGNISMSDLQSFVNAHFGEAGRYAAVLAAPGPNSWCSSA